MLGMALVKAWVLNIEKWCMHKEHGREDKSRKYMFIAFRTTRVVGRVKHVLPAGPSVSGCMGVVLAKIVLSFRKIVDAIRCRLCTDE